MQMSYEHYINAILSNLPNSIYWKDLNGVYLGANIHALRMVGLESVSDLIGKTDYDFISKGEADKFRENDFIVVSTGKELCIEETYLSKEGEERIQLSTKKPIIDSDGKIVGIMGVTIDITNLKMKEKMLCDQTKSLEEALAAKKKFFNNLSHEIRTPIHVIDSIADELYQNFDYFSKEESKNFLGTLLQNSGRLKKLVQNLLEIAKNNQGKSYYCFEKRNIIDVVYEAISEFVTIAKISFNAKHEKVMCNIDTLKIGQVIRNFLDNAIKYGDCKSIAVELEKSRSEQSITIKVKNNGVGVSESECKKVFEPFFRGVNAKSIPGGCGLGLTICKEIITAHRGRIWMDKNLGITSVNFTIPYVEE